MHMNNSFMITIQVNDLLLKTKNKKMFCHFIEYLSTKEYSINLKKTASLFLYIFIYVTYVILIYKFIFVFFCDTINTHLDLEKYWSI